MLHIANVAKKKHREPPLDVGLKLSIVNGANIDATEDAPCLVFAAVPLPPQTFVVARAPLRGQELLLELVQGLGPASALAKVRKFASVTSRHEYETVLLVEQ